MKLRRHQGPYWLWATEAVARILVICFLVYTTYVFLATEDAVIGLLTLLACYLLAVRPPKLPPEA